MQFGQFGGQVQAAQTPGLESYAGLMAEALNGGNGGNAQRLGEALLELLKALRGLGFEIQTHFCESVPGLIRLGNLLPKWISMEVYSWENHLTYSKWLSFQQAMFDCGRVSKEKEELMWSFY